MTFGGSWNVAQISSHFPEKTPEEIREKIGMVPQPTFEGKNTRTLIGGFSIVIPESAEHPDLVHEILMEHLFRAPESYARHLAQVGRFPPAEKIFNHPQYEEAMLEKMPKEWYEKFKEGVSGGVVRPHIPEYPDISNALWKAVQNVVGEKKTPEKALSAAAKEVDNILEN